MCGRHCHAWHLNLSSGRLLYVALAFAEDARFTNCNCTSNSFKLAGIKGIAEMVYQLATKPQKKQAEPKQEGLKFQLVGDKRDSDRAHHSHCLGCSVVPYKNTNKHMKPRIVSLALKFF